jgi:Uma2 family endonuclease
MSVERYLGLVEAGVLAEDDRVELLEGVVVAMTPGNPPHDSCVTRATLALQRAVAGRAVVRPHCSLVVGSHSVAEPDVAVVPGALRDLRASQLEVRRDPDRAGARYRDARTLRAGEPIELAGLPGARVSVADLLPEPR